ncbi:MAG: class I SAM-dependent methyltransferase [Parasporobacterium sp.]|nr:class I SAM-dependent methyltransferase [Parasporobacterium sp.]
MIDAQRLERVWEARLNISTMGRDALKADKNHYAYEPTPYACLERLAASGIITKNSVVVDYGSGKGRVPIFFAETIGCRCIGVDFDSWMFRKAEQNLASWKNSSPRASRWHSKKDQVEFYCMEATEFIPEEGDCFFFFNPFPVSVYRHVQKNILKLNEEEPKQRYLMFYYPEIEYHEALIREAGVMFYDEISCMDLFPGENERERIMIFTCA